MIVTLLIIFIAIAVVFFVLWLTERMDTASREQEFREIKDMRETMGNLFYRLSVIDGKIPAKSELEKKFPDPEAKGRPLTAESVQTALRYHHLTVEEKDPEEPNIVRFIYDQVHYRINTANLPYMSMEAGFRCDSDKEDTELMIQIAQDLTYNMYIAKVFVSPKGDYYVFQVDLLAETYLPFRDSVRTYLDVLIDAQHRFIDQYNRKRAEQKQATQEALQTTLLASQTDAAGNKIVS